MLDDTCYTATFAVMTDACLSFPYKDRPGQRCRSRCSTKLQYSIFETELQAISPSLADVPSPREWIKQLAPEKVLQLKGSTSHVLRFVSKLPRGELLVRWSKENPGNALLMMIPGFEKHYEFQELTDIAGSKEQDVVHAYVISKQSNELPQLPTLNPQNQPQPTRSDVEYPFQRSHRHGRIAAISIEDSELPPGARVEVMATQPQPFRGTKRFS